MWDVGVYQRYDAERARPFDDLVTHVGAQAPRSVVDLGCGPGDRTASLLDRWPDARVVGIDSSPEMIEAASEAALPGRLSFRQADLTEWRPDEPVDVLISNATLQWVPDHLEVLPRLVGAVAPSGWLAFQVPGNFTAPSHTALAELRQSPRWRDRLSSGADRTAAVHDPQTYLAALAELGLRVDAWETTYLHVLPGEDAVLEWTRGTALRPVLAVLDEGEQEEFLADYRARLRAAYPRSAFGTVLPFRRIFVVAQLPGSGP